MLKQGVTKIRQIRYLYLAILLMVGCIEPFDPQTETFESALVIDATITNESRQQQILLSRTFAFEEAGPNPETNATVLITDDAGNEYVFNESVPGTYLSVVAFAAVSGREYQLQLTTSNGRSYASDPTQLTAVTKIDKLYPERLTNDNGAEGIAILVDSFDPSGNARNYRYTYAETYKIIAPKWTPSDLIGDPEGGCGLLVVPRENEEQTCYATDDSNSIILTDTNDFEEDRVGRFPVRFINRNNFIISHRYSILVRQLVQSSEAYTFFETLNSFSGPESLFSETQPGFLSGNVFSEDNPEEKVLGYFDVASVVQQRIFLNYSDFFPGEPLPPYIDPCRENAPPLASPAGCVLRPIVENNLVRYVDSNEPPAMGEGPYLVVPRVCGDCTAIGSIAIPEFWTEE